LWTKIWMEHFKNLELISDLAYVDYVVCMLAQSRGANSASGSN
jgi:hypothetical protein